MSNIVALWQNLLDYDKQRVVFAARHQSRLDTGRLRSPKKSQEFTPGVESVKRHALTTTAPLAQWPDCCRLIETIFVKLCAIHKSPKKKGIGTVSKWVLIYFFLPLFYQEIIPLRFKISFSRESWPRQQNKVPYKKKKKKHIQ